MSYKFEKNYAQGQDLVIDGWEKGIAPSSYSGINDIRAVNVSDIPGAVFASPKTTNNLLDTTTGTVYLGVSKTFTADAATDRITVTGITQELGLTAVTFTNSGGALPAGLSAATTYYLVYISSGVYTVYTTYALAIAAGSPVNITGAGTGTQTVISTNIGTINATAKDDRSGNIFAIDTNNRVWCSNVAGGSYKWTLIAGNTLTSGVGNGIAVWQNYAFAFRGADIDVYGPINSFGTATWSNSWKTMNSGGSYLGLHKTFVASNNTLYWTDFVGNTGGLRNQGFVGSLTLTSTVIFNPADSNLTGSYIYNSQALDFPDNEEPVALNELNGSLITGVNLSGLNSSGISSKLYPWDTVSPSFGNPIFVPEAPIYEIANANNIIYVFCGWRGRVYKTTLSSIVLAFKIPDQLYLPGSSATGYEGLPLFGEVSRAISGGIYKMTFAPQARVSRKKILFCVNLYGSTGLYSYDAETGLLQIDAKPLNGYGTSSSESPSLTGVEVLNTQGSTTNLGTEILFFGLYVNSGTTTYTIDQYNPITKNDSSNFGSYNGSITTDFVNVGTTNNKKTFQQLEYILDRNMISGSGLKIYYRTVIGGSWTLLSTEDFATYGAINSRIITFPINDINWIQLQITLNSYTILRQIRLR